jgi:hypothetical protein
LRMMMMNDRNAKRRIPPTTPTWTKKQSSLVNSNLNLLTGEVKLNQT